MGSPGTPTPSSRAVTSPTSASSRDRHAVAHRRQAMTRFAIDPPTLLRLAEGTTGCRRSPARRAKLALDRSRWICSCSAYGRASYGARRARAARADDRVKVRVLGSIASPAARRGSSHRSWADHRCSLRSTSPWPRSRPMPSSPRTPSFVRRPSSHRHARRAVQGLIRGHDPRGSTTASASAQLDVDLDVAADRAVAGGPLSASAVPRPGQVGLRPRRRRNPVVGVDLHVPDERLRAGRSSRRLVAVGRHSVLGPCVRVAAETVRVRCVQIHGVTVRDGIGRRRSHLLSARRPRHGVVCLPAADDQLDLGEVA